MKKKIVLLLSTICILCFLGGCGGQKKPDDIPPDETTHTKHSWGQWEEETKASCTTSGLKKRECSECDEIETEEIPPLNHSYKDGYCIRCDAVDPSTTQMIDGREFASVQVDNQGLLTFSRLKCASKYTLEITYAGQENTETVTLPKTEGSYSLSDLPTGRTMVVLTAYENVEVEIDGKKYDQEVSISTATDEFRITKVNQTYTLERLKYTDEYITLDGFYDVPRVDASTNESYYLYETVYKAPSLGNIMNNSHIKDAKKFKLKDTTKHKLVYYESDGKTSFALGGGHYMQVERATYMKYYIAVVEKDTNVEVKRYPIRTYGLTEVELKFKKLTITEEDGNRTVEISDLKSSMFFTEKDILEKEELYNKIDSNLIGRTSTYQLLERGNDFIIPASNSYGEVVLYFYERDLVEKDCKEYQDLLEKFIPFDYGTGWSLTVRDGITDVVIPAKALGYPVFSASLSSVSAETLTLEEGITEWMVNIYDCNHLKGIFLPSTITYMKDHSFGGVPKDCIIYCGFKKEVADHFTSLNWNWIVGEFKTYQTYYSDSVVYIDGIGVMLSADEAVITAYQDSFTGYIPHEISFGNKIYTIKKIGDGVFKDCAVSSIEIEEGIEEIGESAFENCSNLLSVIVPSSVKKIGKSAFKQANQLESIELPFVGASLEEETNTHFGYIFGANSYTSNPSNVPSSLKKVVIRNGIISSRAFYKCKFLENVELGDGVQSIKEYGFSQCDALTEIVLGKSIEEIEGGAFSGTSPLIIYNYSSLELEKGSSNYGGIAYGACVIYTHPGEKSKTFVFEDYLVLEENDTYYIIKYLGNDTELVLPEFILGKPYGIYTGAFSQATISFTSVEVPNTVFSIGYGAFSGHPLQSITLPYIGASKNDEENAYLGYIFGTSYDFSGRIPSTLKKVVITDTDRIGKYAFLECDKIEEFVFESEIKLIDASAFKSCSMTSFKVPDSVTTIGEYAFAYCHNLTNIELSQSLKEIKERAFSSCDKLTHIEIPSSVERIGFQAFASCDKLQSLGLPDKYIEMDTSIVYQCNSMQYYELDNGCYLGNDENPNLYLVMIASQDKTIESFTVASGTKYTFGDVSAGYLNIANVTFPDSIVAIGPAFWNGLENLYFEGTIEDWCNVKYDVGIPVAHFHIMNQNQQWEEVTELVIPGSVLVIGKQFKSFNGITSLTIQDGVKTIDEGAFAFCNHLQMIVIGSTVENIDDNSFGDCPSLHTIVIGRGLQRVGDYAFSGSSSISVVYYEGTSEEWDLIDFPEIEYSTNYLTAATRYYYSETEQSGCWHYVEGVPTIW